MKSLLLLFVLFRCSTAITPATVYDGFMRNVRLLVVEGEQTRHCSGVVLKTNLVLSAAHCNGVGLTVNGEPAKVIRIDAENDLLLLSVDTLEFAPLVIGRIPVPSSPVYTISNVGGYRDQVFRGHVASVEEKFLNVDVTAGPGASGSGIYDAYGRLVGISSQLYLVADLPIFVASPNTAIIRSFVGDAL